MATKSLTLDTTNGEVSGVDAVAPGDEINGASSKTPPVDADEFGIADSADTWTLKKLSWANLKATIATYYDSLTTTVTNKTISGSSNTLSNISQSSVTSLTTDLAGKATSAQGTLADSAVQPNDALSSLDTTVTGTQLNAIKTLTDTVETNADVTDAVNVASVITGLSAAPALAGDELFGITITGGWLRKLTVSALSGYLDDDLNFAPISHSHTVSDITSLTATVTELNYTDGVTSAIQTQLNGKAINGHQHTLANVTDVTASAAELNKMDGVTATTAEINKTDGLTATTTELNYTDGVTSAIQTQLNGKAASAHNHAATNITSGTMAIARLPTGATSSTVCIGNDSRLSDARTPTSHSHPTTDITSLTATATELNKLDGATVTTAEINILDGVTATTAEINNLDGIEPVGGEDNGTATALTLWKGTQAQYDAIGTPDSSTVYVVT